MRILIVRHGDPDYEIDSLTEKGWSEAGHLAERLASEKIDAFYVSPLGRAKDTASLTLKCTGRTAEEKEWLKEFPVRIRRPDRDDKKMIAWDWLPQDWTKDERFWQSTAMYAMGSSIAPNDLTMTLSVCSATSVWSVCCCPIC